MIKEYYDELNLLNKNRAGHINENQIEKCDRFMATAV